MRNGQDAALRPVSLLLGLAVALGMAGCGRRGPPLPPLQVDPEPPRVEPLRQEDGQVVVRWFAPRLSSGGNVEDLRLRKAIVSFRVVDLERLASEERVAQRAPPEETEPEESDEGESEEEAPGDEAPHDTSDSPDTEAASESPADPAADEPAEAPDEGEAPAPDRVTEAVPEAEAALPGDTSGAESLAEVAEPEGEPQPTAEPDAESDPTAEPEMEPIAEPEAEPEPEGGLLDYEDLEFELLSEVESEVPGEERILELPVESDWIGRRLEIRVRSEARGGESEESDPESLDITGPLPAVEGVAVEVGPGELTIRWDDPRGALAPTLFSDPLFEVFRRRGDQSERLGRSLGLSQADPDVVWGEEVCYRARLVLAGTDEDRVIPDPGPLPPNGRPEDEGGEMSPPPEHRSEERTPRTPGMESGDPEGEEAPLPGGEEGSLPEEPEPGEEPWTPIPVRVPGTGPGALGIGPMSTEACVTPVDTFPPVPPSDLRLFWRSEQTDLSWRESATVDVLGYHVYRTGPDGVGFQRLTSTIIEQMSYTDANRDPEGRYRYAVTAVDGADPPNESLPSDSRQVNPR